MAKMSTDELLDAFKEMTLLELSDFVKQFEDTFGARAVSSRARRSRPTRSTRSLTSSLVRFCWPSWPAP